MKSPAPTLAYLTAGAAGMYCGSCMHDNTLARALAAEGMDVQLIPTYTPIRTDENNVSVDRVFFGGINIYLQQKIPLFRYLPAIMDRWLDNPWLIRKLTAKAVETSPQELGDLTVSMLRGASGFQRKEVRRLCRWLASSVQPDLIVLSNILIGGCIPELKRQLRVPVVVTLQGDDIFLDNLPEKAKADSIAEIQRLVTQVDGFITHSQFYLDQMADYLSIPKEKMFVTPLGLDTDSFPETPLESTTADRPPTVGYLARLAPEKGSTHSSMPLSNSRIGGRSQICA